MIYIEYRLIKKREIDILQKFNKAIVINSVEKQYLDDHKGGFNGEILEIPPFVAKYLPKTYFNNDQIIHCFFIGNMENAHNYNSIIELCNELQELEIRKHLHLDVIGRINDPSVFDIYPFVTYLGFLDDLDIVLPKYDLLLAPISFGTGVKTKILDALSYGVPVITNQYGIENLKSGFEDFILCYNQSHELLKYLNDIYNNKRMIYNMSIKIKPYIDKNYSYNVVKNKYLQLLDIDNLF